MASAIRVCAFQMRRVCAGGRLRGGLVYRGLRLSFFSAFSRSALMISASMMLLAACCIITFAASSTFNSCSLNTFDSFLSCMLHSPLNRAKLFMPSQHFLKADKSQW